MRLRGYQLTRYADDWVVTCKSAAEARAAVEAARRILKQLGVELHPQKTRIVHVRDGFEFLGYKIKRGQKKLHLPESKIRSQARQGALYAYPKEKSIRRFMDQVRQRTKRKMPLQDQGADCGTESTLAGMGRVLQTRPRPQALPPSRRLDCATDLVASVQALAQRRLETAARDHAVRRVRACQLDRVNSFSCISASLSLRESCIRENCTCSLSGGRRLARKRASSDPTTLGYSVPVIRLEPRVGTPSSRCMLR